ncbi:MAG: hypothetical protein IKQ52_05510 [Bacteroidales bacterium]|nr:hypothetical protein [Bacteroidales bacterium]
MKKIFLITIWFLFVVACADAQVTVADSLPSIFHRWEVRMDGLQDDDPEIVSLHYLFLQDIRKQMDKTGEQLNVTLARSPKTDFYAVKREFRRLTFKAEQMQERLSVAKARVDHDFYLRAVEELAYRDTVRAMYNLERALQYNPLNPDAMLQKCKILLAQGQYQPCVDLIHKVYTEATLDEAQERAVSDFTLVLYDKLYTHGSTLVESGRSAEALEVFLALEHFCNNMPSGYCNDDYYKGIVLSREGVYESYLSIAREAEKRGNHEMSRKFYQYAEEYLRKNE